MVCCLQMEIVFEEQTGQNTIDMIYYPDVNEYNGTRTLQAIIKIINFIDRSVGEWECRHDFLSILINLL